MRGAPETSTVTGRVWGSRRCRRPPDSAGAAARRRTSALSPTAVNASHSGAGSARPGSPSAAAAGALACSTRQAPPAASASTKRYGASSASSERTQRVACTPPPKSVTCGRVTCVRAHLQNAVHACPQQGTRAPAAPQAFGACDKRAWTRGRRAARAPRVGPRSTLYAALGTVGRQQQRMRPG